MATPRGLHFQTAKDIPKHTAREPGRRVIDRLRQHRVRQLAERLAVGPAYEDKDLVFADAVGTPLHPSALRQTWLSVTKSVGLKLRIHDLRHIHASLLLHQGVHPKVVSERLGHSTVGVTLDLYSHVTPTLQAQAAEQIEALLANG